MSYGGLVSQTLFAGKIDGTTPTVIFEKGGTIEEDATGDYDITLDTPCDATECCVLVTLETADLTVYVQHTSDTVKQVLTRDATPQAADAVLTAVVQKYLFT